MSWVLRARLSADDDEDGSHFYAGAKGGRVFFHFSLSASLSSLSAPRYADMLRVALHLKPKSPASLAARIAGTGLDSLFCTCQAPCTVGGGEGAFSLLTRRQRQEEFPGLWRTEVPDPVGAGLPKVVNIFLFTGVSKSLEACSGPEITGTGGQAQGAGLALGAVDWQ